jgi:hypothetical protein
MKQFVLGFVLGSVVFGVGVALAAPGVLYNMTNQPIGTTANPIYIQLI